MTQDQIPEKFKDKEGNLNTDALLKSYCELEKKLSIKQPDKSQVPDSPEEYQINLKSELLKQDPDINKQLFEAGFTNKQAQLVYDLAAEKVIPILQQISAEVRSSQELNSLQQDFGGPEQFANIARQITTWAENNLPADMVEALSSSREGILMLYKMMCEKTGEPSLIQKSEPEQAQSIESLREMMKDPRYWKQADPAYIKKVEDGFKRLYNP